MAIFGITKSKIYNQNIKLIIVPMALLSILVVLFVVLVQNGYRRITSDLNDLENSRKTELLLEQKLESLRTIDPLILDKADVTLIALPERNPSSFFLTHVRRIGNEKEVSFTKIKTSSRQRVDDDVKKAEITLEFEASDNDVVIDFLKEIRRVLPIALINKVEIVGAIGVKNTSATISIFWSDLPTELPPITQPIKALKNEEQVLLSEITSYVNPEFILLDPNDPTDRENPFN